MRKLIGVIAVALLVVAFSAPASAFADDSAGCSTANTAFSQPQGKPEPYKLSWKGFDRRIVAKGSVAATFTGVCRGFLSGVAKVRVRMPNGKIYTQAKTFSNLEFKNGYLDTGKRFTFGFGMKFTGPVPAGTCVTVTAYWEPWRFNDNRLVTDDIAKAIRTRGCYRST